jgi:alkylation response protein AidB-like acyl-CoA dehydrogenase
MATTLEEGRTGAAFMSEARDTLEALLPGLDERLEAQSLSDLERRGGPGLPAFKEAGGPGLLAPKDRGGIGASPLEAIQVQRAIASRSPSVAIGTNMHHLSIASFVESLEAGYPADAPEWALVQGIAENNLLVSSALAEGRSGVSNMLPTVRAERRGEEFVVNGSKKPCSLSSSMQLFSGTVVIEGDDEHAGDVAFVIVPVGTPGMEVREFWQSDILAGAESDEVRFDDVVVPEGLVVPTEMQPGEAMDPLLIRGWTWFELLMLGAYVGVASGVLERVLVAGKGSPADIGAMGSALEAAMSAAEGVAHRLTGGMDPARLLPHALLVRYAVQDAVVSVTNQAADVMGGIAFITDPDIAYLVSAARALAFHPPSRGKGLPALGRYVQGEQFDTRVF